MGFFWPSVPERQFVRLRVGCGSQCLLHREQPQQRPVACRACPDVPYQELVEAERSVLPLLQRSCGEVSVCCCYCYSGCSLVWKKPWHRCSWSSWNPTRNRHPRESEESGRTVVETPWMPILDWELLSLCFSSLRGLVGGMHQFEEN